MRQRRAGLVAALLLLTTASLTQAQVWPREKAETWYAAQPWLVGSNYIPSTAINQLEMWQADTFDPKRIDEELGWAEGLGICSCSSTRAGTRHRLSGNSARRKPGVHNSDGRPDRAEEAQTIRDLTGRGR